MTNGRGTGKCTGSSSTACTGGKGAWQSLDFVQWSADGSSVFFTRSADIFVAAADGSRLRQIVDEMPGLPGVGPMSAFSVSPDGGRLVYSTCRYPPTRLQDVAERLDRDDYQYEIAISKIDGTDPERLTFDDSYSNFPMWSPDGTRIAFLSGRHVRESNRYRASFLEAHLYTMAPDGSEVRDLTLGLGAVANHPPQWAPDGRRLAFVGIEREVGRRESLRSSAPKSTRSGPTGRTSSGSQWRSAGRRGRRTGSGSRLRSPTAPRWRSSRSRRTGRMRSGSRRSTAGTRGTGSRIRRAPGSRRWRGRRRVSRFCIRAAGRSAWSTWTGRRWGGRRSTRRARRAGRHRPGRRTARGSRSPAPGCCARTSFSTAWRRMGPTCGF